MRFTITITSIFIALKYKDKHTISLIYWAIAIIFNPLIPVYLDKVIWKIMDFIIACIYLKELNSNEGYLIKNGTISDLTNNIATITTENLSNKNNQIYAIIVEFFTDNN